MHNNRPGKPRLEFPAQLGFRLGMSHAADTDPGHGNPPRHITGTGEKVDGVEDDEEPQRQPDDHHRASDPLAQLARRSLRWGQCRRVLEKFAKQVLSEEISGDNGIVDRLSTRHRLDGHSLSSGSSPLIGPRPWLRHVLSGLAGPGPKRRRTPNRLNRPRPRPRRTLDSGTLVRPRPWLRRVLSSSDWFFQRLHRFGTVCGRRRGLVRLQRGLGSGSRLGRRRFNRSPFLQRSELGGGQYLRSSRPVGHRTLDSADGLWLDGLWLDRRHRDRRHFRRQRGVTGGQHLGTDRPDRHNDPGIGGELHLTR
ncbi:hypothetical protein MUY22_11465 [Amycolatopsis sp. WQ 127309]|nr:hypothetical protein [Amycolatopsis sp. WQ 127309]UOZ08852.1 hypothetical protein MUY22_11465 [Amycolatopsis sp. WQ 127309]